jgi:hypothetical protein
VIPATLTAVVSAIDFSCRPASYVGVACPAAATLAASNYYPQPLDGVVDRAR